jgi:hypothetical protein
MHGSTNVIVCITLLCIIQNNIKQVFTIILVYKPHMATTKSKHMFHEKSQTYVPFSNYYC